MSEMVNTPSYAKGCIDPAAVNYDGFAGAPDVSCQYDCDALAGGQLLADARCYLYDNVAGRWKTTATGTLDSSPWGLGNCDGCITDGGSRPSRRYRHTVGCTKEHAPLQTMGPWIAPILSAIGMRHPTFTTKTRYQSATVTIYAVMHVGNGARTPRPRLDTKGEAWSRSSTKSPTMYCS